MSASLASFKETVERLIRRFESDRPYYLSKGYSEAQARVDFITPFFKALGWDVENEAGLPHHQREVIVERGESEATGRPDYNFRIGGQTKFYVEAKGPSEGLDNPHHILQAKGYAWNTRSVFFVILTDFEEFRFYDASRQPDERNPDEGLLLKLGYAGYVENAEKLWDFSRERVAAGSLDAFLPKIRRAPHLRKQVDDVFLDEMTGWREELAKDIHKQNPALTAKQLNEVVQRLLDRIVFIRIAEHRHVIEKRQLADVVEEWQTHGGKFPIFDWLNALFHKINDDFNGEIFKPHLSEEIQIDSEILARIIKRLYPPKSPYRFDVIGVELLGSIYERYLGNTIRLTPKQVRVEEKPEVRKAGGVYYTPKYIVDYIVKNTVGKIIEGKSPKQIEKIRILDPACGSGSFLIGAFQYLIDYHTQWYLEHPEQEVRHAHPSLDFMREVRTDPDGSKRLSVYRKAKILRNNLFGVDIDPQAVEITMMSLYLKALEGEQSQLPPKQHLLPELKYNVMCGNSLIGPDIYDQAVLFAEEEKDRINAFDWNFIPPVAAVYDRRLSSENEPALIERRYSKGTASAPTPPTSIGQVMKDGGFDCVIGNPPYVRPHRLARVVKECLWKSYATFVKKSDLYNCFIEKAVGVLRRHGFASYVVSDGWLRLDSFQELRRYILDQTLVREVVDLPHGVFEDAVVKTSIFVVEKAAGAADRKRNLIGVRRASVIGEDLERLERRVIPQSAFASTYKNIFDLSLNPAVDSVKRKMRAVSSPLGTFVRVQFGLKTGDDAKFVATSKKHEDDKKLLRGENVRRYSFNWAGEWVWYAPQKMTAHRSTARPGDPERFEQPKVMVKDTTRDFGSVFEEGRFYAKDVLILTHPMKDPDFLKYLLAILNSSLMRFYYRTSFPTLHVQNEEIRQLPIRPINLSDPTDKARQDKVVALVDRMLEMNKRKHSGKLAPSELDRLEREIASTDREIDELVYELYGITDEERKLIGGRL